jgi:hypothetical protein
VRQPYFLNNIKYIRGMTAWLQMTVTRISNGVINSTPKNCR